jgi:hypothetical protein
MSIILGLAIILVRKRYRKFDGEILVIKTENGDKTYSLELYSDPDDIELKDYILFRVRKTV